MSILSWVVGILWTALHLAWSVVWFLVGGWFSTLAQIFVLFCIILLYKYGWQRAPAEILSRLSHVLRYLWAWMRQREVPILSEARQYPRGVRAKEFGDINVSTLLNILLLFSFVLYSFF